MRLKDAVEHAINKCIAEGILEKFLRKNRAEVMDVSIFEYNAEEEIRKYKIAESEFLREKISKEIREEFKGKMEEAREKVREEVTEEVKEAGAKQKCISLILSFVGKLGEVPDTLKEQLETKDEQTLDKLVELASNAESVAHFMNNLY